MTHLKRYCSIIICMALLSVSCASAQDCLTLRAETKDSGVSIYVGDQLFTHYRTLPDWKYPYFYPVNGPSTNQSLTTETSEPYPHHHSLFFGCDRVNGGNYWQEGLERGQILSKKIRLIKKEGPQIIFEDQCRWERPGAEPPIEDTRKIIISAPSKDIRLIDFTISLKALMDVRIDKTNHSLFSARMKPELSVKEGGTLINAAGLLSEKGTFGQASPWCDYSGKRDGKVEGLAILSHPSNRWFPEKWFTRDYGFFSPTPMYWPEGDHTSIKKGEIITLRYRVVAHNGDSESAKIESIYKQWKTQ
jgi:methane monooxygenase PmoA-like